MLRISLHFLLLAITTACHFPDKSLPEFKSPTTEQPQEALEKGGAFASMCRKKDSLDAAQQKTIDELLEIANETDCEKAEKILAAKEELELNRAEDISALKSFKNLKSLVLEVASMGFGVLSNFQLLTNLEIWNNRVKDFEPNALKGMAHLEHFFCGFCDSLAPIMVLPEKDRLKSAIIGYLPGLDGIEKFKNLETVSIAHGEIKDLSPLKGLVELNHLSLPNSHLSGDLTALSDLKKLRRLTLFLESFTSRLLSPQQFALSSGPGYRGYKPREF